MLFIIKDNATLDHILQKKFCGLQRCAKSQLQIAFPSKNST